MPNEPRKRKRIRSPGQTQIAVSIDVALLDKIRARARSREQSISGYLRYLALLDLEAAEKEAAGAFPPIRELEKESQLEAGREPKVSSKPKKRKANPVRYDTGESVGSSKAS